MIQLLCDITGEIYRKDFGCPKDVTVDYNTKSLFLVPWPLGFVVVCSH